MVAGKLRNEHNLIFDLQMEGFYQTGKNQVLKARCRLPSLASKPAFLRNGLEHPLLRSIRQIKNNRFPAGR